MPPKTTLQDILLAQIEDHRPEIFYNTDPMRYGGAFVKRLPSAVKKSLCWRAAPSPGADFGAYDFVLCNFPSIIAMWRDLGFRSEHFAPAHDPRMNPFAANDDRPIDVAFVGAYSRHHAKRAEVLEAVASLQQRYQLRFCLDVSRMTRLAETPLGFFPPLSSLRRPNSITRLAVEPVFGTRLYDTLSRAKIVLNGAIDMAGSDRGNMRCFEAMGCGALLVTDYGSYPNGMVHDENMIVYQSASHAVTAITDVLEQWPLHRELAKRGHRMVQQRYSKARQWQRFQELIAIA